jgi:hypothetical protein
MEQNMKRYAQVLAFAGAVFATDFATAAEYGREKIAQWGDPFTLPETRQRCVSMAWGKWPWGGEWKTCNGHAVDHRTMQVAVYVKTLGPDGLTQAAANVVTAVAKTCSQVAAAAGMAGLVGTPSPELGGRLATGYAAAKTAFLGCIGAKANELTAVGVATTALNLGFDTESYWSAWSNETAGPTPPGPTGPPAAAPIVNRKVYYDAQNKKITHLP